MVRILRSMQVAVPRQPSVDAVKDPVEQLQDELSRSSLSDDALPTGTGQPKAMEVPHPHLFAIGDVADAFGAIKAGHTAYHQVRAQRLLYGNLLIPVPSGRSRRS